MDTDTVQENNSRRRQSNLHRFITTQFDRLVNGTPQIELTASSPVRKAQPALPSDPVNLSLFRHEALHSRHTEATFLRIIGDQE